MLQTVESTSHFQPETSSSSRKKLTVNQSPRYLYQRGNIFYFRYALPRNLREQYQHSEIRMSLRTGFVHQARKMARHLSSCLEEMLMAGEHKTYQELRDELAQKLEDYLAGFPDKTPPSITDIKARMDDLRQKHLAEADAELYQPPSGVLVDEEQPETVAPEEWLDHSHQVFLKPATNNPEALFTLHYPQAILELLKGGIFKPEELTNEIIPQILNEYNKMHISLNRIFFQREHGNYAYEREFIQPASSQSNPVCELTASQNPDKEELLLSEFIKKFVDTKIRDGLWTKRNVPTHQSRIDTLLDILGDIPVSEIDRNKMRKFRDTLTKLPPNRKKSKEYKDKTIDEILQLPIKKTLDISTVNTTMETISGMFEWGIREELIDKNPAKELTIKDDRQDIERKDAFTQSDINTIFFSGHYNENDFINPAYYWVPLIGLYTGMRLEEICQLHIEDIYQEDGIWLFDIRTDSSDGLDDKIVKTKNAVRRIPIHPDLIKLGLISYRDKTAVEGVRLFPKLSKTEASPKYGKQVGKQFAALLKKRNIQGKKSFHSLRHTFSDYFKRLNLHTDIFRQIFGHEADKLAAKQYGSKFPIKQCYDELISKIDWHVDDDKNQKPGSENGGQPKPAAE